MLMFYLIENTTDISLINSITREILCHLLHTHLIHLSWVYLIITQPIISTG